MFTWADAFQLSEAQSEKATQQLSIVGLLMHRGACICADAALMAASRHQMNGLRAVLYLIYIEGLVAMW